MDEPRDTKVGRREFVGLAAAATAGFTILKPSTVWGTQANSAVRLGVVGCGGRGTAVTGSFLRNTGAVVTAVADIFQDNLEAGKKRLDAISEKLGKPAVDVSHLFRGYKAYEQLSASKDIDAVYIATPPYFHPEHLEAAIAAGKHVYLEKPAAVDVPGAKKIMALGEKAAKAKLSLSVGFQIRYASPYVLLEKRVREGQIGSMVSGQVHYFASNIDRPPFADRSADERRLRNWIHEKTLSGDIIVEQNIHLVDVTNWLLDGRPLKAYGRCGRAGRTDPATAPATSTASSPTPTTSTSVCRRPSTARPPGASGCSTTARGALRRRATTHRCGSRATPRGSTRGSAGPRPSTRRPR